MRPFMFGAMLTLSLAACNGTARDVDAGKHTLPKGGSAIISIPSETPMLVSFGFELGSPSWDAAAECPERNVGTETRPFMMQICGGLFDANDESEYSSHVQAMHGGGVSFEPKDGMIRVRLENYAGREMTFEIEAEKT